LATLKTLNGVPVPQAYNDTLSDYEILKSINGALRVSTEANTEDVTFHDAAVVAADGTVYTVGNKKTLTVEIDGTSASRTVAFIGRGPADVDRAIMGLNLTSMATAVSTTGTGELWQFDITGLSAVFMDLQAVSGGNVTVKGRAVA
jgi:ribosomal 30S subunit maturation factor RimM